MKPLDPGFRVQQIEKRRLRRSTFMYELSRFARIYSSAFPSYERRRISSRPIDGIDDDGELPGRAIDELLDIDCVHLHGYFAEQGLVGFTLTIDLGPASFGDSMARCPSFPARSGLGARMLFDWIASATALDQDAIIEVEPVSETDSERGAETDAALEIREQRLEMFRRRGFMVLTNSRYSLPSGRRMLLAVRPRPSRSLDANVAGGPVDFPESEARRLIASIEATYDPHARFELQR
jgi:hypothetical protein